MLRSAGPGPQAEIVAPALRRNGTPPAQCLTPILEQRMHEAHDFTGSQKSHLGAIKAMDILTSPLDAPSKLRPRGQDDPFSVLK